MKSTDKLSSLMDAVNGVHPAISYTHEVETNNTLNFLDVTCVRSRDADAVGFLTASDSASASGL